jgi:hypothetical protein
VEERADHLDAGHAMEDERERAVNESISHDNITGVT